ncbi:MAG: hypothetical protein GX605_03905 [Chloroflexi bacterium]|nr:hypothetical protein [Chloroflexota bacterium]
MVTVTNSQARAERGQSAVWLHLRRVWARWRSENPALVDDALALGAALVVAAVVWIGR